LAKNQKFILFVNFSAYVGQEDNVQMRILAGAIVGTVVVVVLVIVLVVLFFKRYGIKTSESNQLLLLPHMRSMLIVRLPLCVSAAAPTTATRSSQAIVIPWNTETAKVGI
jgi:uncharacterized membrane protein YqiK